MNKLFSNIYFNLICPPDDPSLYTEQGIPACLNMTDPTVCLTTDFNFANPGDLLVTDLRTLLVNLYSVCEVSYTFASFGEKIVTCSPTADAIAKRLPICIAEYGYSTSSIRPSEAFDAVVYSFFIISVIYWIVCGSPFIREKMTRERSASDLDVEMAKTYAIQNSGYLIDDLEDDLGQSVHQSVISGESLGKNNKLYSLFSRTSG